MAEMSSWVSAGAEVVIALGLGLNWMQMRADHDRSRRERAVEYILGWTRYLDQRGTAARKLVEKLSFEQASDLFNQEAFEIDERHGGYIASVFADMPEKIAGKYKIDLKMSAELRWLVVTYLNNLEAILVGWRHNVADRDIVAEQFRYLVSPQQNHFILENFRNAADGPTNYPGIAEFVQELKARAESVPPGRSMILGSFPKARGRPRRTRNS